MAGPTTSAAAASSASSTPTAPASSTTAAPAFGAFEERARKATHEAVERVLVGHGFDASRVPDWCDEIGANTVAALATQLAGYRFTATVTIMQRGKGAGVSTASAAAFDPSTDGSVTVRWENASLLCLVSVFGLACA